MRVGLKRKLIDLFRILELRMAIRRMMTLTQTYSNMSPVDKVAFLSIACKACGAIIRIIYREGQPTWPKLCECGRDPLKLPKKKKRGKHGQ
jgi:hypothetical protein